MRITVIVLTATLALASVVWGAAKPRPAQSSSAPSAAGNQNANSSPNENADAMRVEGERRFRANCSRCHAAPHRFPPRMMATIVRHMRVRATITDEDMRVILYYMTE
jgi:cytochrome c5